MFSRCHHWLADHTDASTLMLRLGLAAMMGAAGVHKFVAPQVWAGYVAPSIGQLLPVTNEALMLGNGVLEVAIAILLLADVATVLVAAFSAVYLAGITANLVVAQLVQGFPYMEVIVRDVGLVALALALAFDAAGD